MSGTWSAPATARPPVAGGPLLASLGLVALAWAIAYWPTVRDMAAIWARSDTFAHGFVVLPISVWLLWSLRGRLADAAPAPAWIAAPALLLATFGWLAGRTFSVAALEHLASVAVLVSAVWLAVGHRTFRAIAFPLLFLFFMAPFGDFLVPTLMHYTAEFTVAALRASGVPVFQEGNHFVIPNGRWSVVEACSGIRYLIASFMVGTLYAYLNYRHWTKRALFVLASLAVPIVANWLRAYLIVMLGYLSDNRLAAGVDHLIYGWVFFGVIILAMFWIGNRWADPRGPEAQGAGQGATARTPGARAMVAVVAALFAGALAGHLLQPQERALQIEPRMPEANGDWLAASEIAYRPALSGHRGFGQRTYALDGESLSLAVAIYADQVAGRELVGWDNKMVPDDDAWRIIERRAETLGGRAAEYLRIHGPNGPLNVWRWYRVGDAVMAGAVEAKLRVAWQRLTHGNDVGAHLVLAVPGEDRTAAHALAEDFLAAHRARLEAALDEAAAAVP